MANKIQLRRDLSSNWNNSNPVLDQGELGVELDTNKVKIGNGVDQWTDLEYLKGDVSTIQGPTGAAGEMGPTGPAGEMGPTGAAGTANTGDVTFDGVKVIGAGTASGDGAGYSTLELVPDNNLYGNNQYLVIDPTAPSHIHIRAGGTQDASMADLFLGGEKNHVRVSDASGVYLKNERTNSNYYFYADPTDFNSGTWFTDGVANYVQYTVPTNPELGLRAFEFGNNPLDRLYANDGTNYYTLTSAGSITNLGGGTWKIQVTEVPPTSPVTLTNINFEIFSIVINEMYLANNDFRVDVTDDVRIIGSDLVRLINNSATSPVEIIADDNNTSRTWAFGVDGTLTFPDGTIQTTAFTSGIVGPTGPQGEIGPTGPAGATGPSMTIPGPYADDSAAASAGVAIGSTYYQTSGQVFVRLT